MFPSFPAAQPSYLSSITAVAMALSRSCIYSPAFETYLLLQERHEELSSRLQQIRARPRAAVCIPARSLSPSTDSAIFSQGLSMSSGHLYGRSKGRCSACACAFTERHLDTILDEETLIEISVEERRLFDVNESIKRALTELLNCDNIRSNSALRTWAQARLMKTEKELRSGRRKSSPPRIHHLVSPMPWEGPEKLSDVSR